LAQINNALQPHKYIAGFYCLGSWQTLHKFTLQVSPLRLCLPTWLRRGYPASVGRAQSLTDGLAGVVPATPPLSRSEGYFDDINWTGSIIEKSGRYYIHGAMLSRRINYLQSGATAKHQHRFNR